MSAAALNPLARLASAEAGLVAGIDAACSALDEIATGPVDAALCRLEEAARRAHSRLALAMASLNAAVYSVVECAESMATGLLEDLSTPDWLARYEQLSRAGRNGTAPAEPLAPPPAAAPALRDACQEALRTLNGHSTEVIPAGEWNRVTRLLGDALSAAEQPPADVPGSPPGVPASASSPAETTPTSPSPADALKAVQKATTPPAGETVDLLSGDVSDAPTEAPSHSPEDAPPAVDSSTQRPAFSPDGPPRPQSSAAPAFAPAAAPEVAAVAEEEVAAAAACAPVQRQLCACGGLCDSGHPCPALGWSSGAGRDDRAVPQPEAKPARKGRGRKRS